MEDGVAEILRARVAFVDNEAGQTGEIESAQHHDGHTDDGGDAGNLLGADAQTHVLRSNSRRSPHTETLRSPRKTICPLGASVPRCVVITMRWSPPMPGRASYSACCAASSG